MNLSHEVRVLKLMVDTGVETLTPTNHEPNVFVKGGAWIYALALYPILRLTGQSATEIQADQDETRKFHRDVKSGRFGRS